MKPVPAPAYTKGKVQRGALGGVGDLVLNATPASEPFGPGNYWNGTIGFWGGDMVLWASDANPAVGKISWQGPVADVAITYSAGSPIVASTYLYETGGGIVYYVSAGPDLTA